MNSDSVWIQALTSTKPGFLWC